jgi:uncharacterized repeat protein (TIGR01451 family)
MQPKFLAFCASLLAAFAADAGAACMTDTAQSDFQAGIADNIDVASSPGSVVLVKSFAVDQQNTDIAALGTPMTTTAWVGQTFTPRLSGRLTRVDLNLFCLFCSGTTPSIKVSVRATAAGLPTGADLALATIASIASNGSQAYYSAIFATPATLTAGTQYALVVRPTTNPASGSFALSRSGTSLVGADVYAGGALVNGANAGASWSVQTFQSGSQADAGFKTYIHGGYAPEGTWTSATRDSSPPVGATPSWTTLSWTGSTPTDTQLRFQAGASNSSDGPFNFVGPNGTGATFFTTSGASLSQFNGFRYLRYRAYLSSTDSVVTPTLNDVTACFATASDADLTITNSNGVSSSTAGTTVTYTIKVTNSGPSSITGASVTDAFPPALTCMWSCAVTGSGQCTALGWGNIADSISLASGSSATYTAMCALSSTATGSLANTASVMPPAGVNDPDLGSNSVTDTDTLAVTTNVVMTKDDSATRVRSGDVLDYLIELTNENGPSDAVVNVTDALPAKLANGSWVCTGSGSATCGNGSGNTLSDTATVPVGGKVDYVFSATVVAGDGPIANSASGTLQSGTNQPSASIGATDTDTIVVFADGFEAAPDALLADVAVAANGASELRLGIDSGLLARLGVEPVTIATGLAVDGTALFRIELLRLRSGVMLRTLVPRAAGMPPLLSPWKPADLAGALLDVSWRPVWGRNGSEGRLAIGAGSARFEVAHASTQPLARLQVARQDRVPWLVVVAP